MLVQVGSSSCLIGTLIAEKLFNLQVDDVDVPLQFFLGCQCQSAEITNRRDFGNFGTLVLFFLRLFLHFFLCIYSRLTLIVRLAGSASSFFSVS